MVVCGMHPFVIIARDTYSSSESFKGRPKVLNGRHSIVSVAADTHSFSESLHVPSNGCMWYGLDHV